MGNRRGLRNLGVDDGQILMETNEMDERALRNRLLDQVEDVVGLTDGDVDSEHSEQMLIFWVIDAGDGSRDVKLLAGNLADHGVVFVFPRPRDNDVSTRSARRCLRPGLGAVSADRDSAKD